MTFGPDDQNREISPIQLELFGRNTQNVSKNIPTPSARSKSMKNRKNRQNPTFSTRTINSSEGETGQKYVSSPRRFDSSTSSTMESDDVTSMSGSSDKTDTSETLIYKLPRSTNQDVAMFRQRKYQPGKFVYTPDM